MFSRCIQIGLGTCLLLTLFAVYKVARYTFSSGEVTQTTSSAIMFGVCNHSINNGDYGHVQQPVDRISPTQQVLVTTNLTKELFVKTRMKDNTSPIHIWLLSYQRSGSSVISSLFGDNPYIFFLYEPLDSIYTALYGLSPGWAVPADLAVNRNGTLRKMPNIEKESVTTFLKNIYECEFDKLPTEFFIHPFWWQFMNWTEQVKPYVSCLSASGVSVKTLSYMQRYLRIFCGIRTGYISGRQVKCLGKLWPNYRGQELLSRIMIAGKLRFVHVNTKKSYITSLREMRKKCNYCINKHLRVKCIDTRVRAVKTVRGTMDEAEVLLENDPNFKVVHLLRDPRGVTRSRMKATWSRGFYDAHKEERTAHVYCTTALQDYKTSERLRRKYPQRLMHIMLEDFISEPEETLAGLSDFLGISFNEDTLHNLIKRMRPGFVDKWRHELSSDLVDIINRECKELITALDIAL